MSQTVARAIEILEYVSTTPRTQTEVAKHLGVHRSTALRLLETLTTSGLVRRWDNGRYGVGYRLAGLAALALEQFDLAKITRPHLQELCEISTHTVHLAVLERDRIVYADKVEPPRSIRLYSQIGQPVCFHTAGVSKAILAYQPENRVRSMLAGHEFERHTDTTITDLEEFVAQLRTTRDNGFAVDDGEFEDYVNCIAMPIRDATGEVLAAVSVTALKARADLESLTRLLPDLGRAVTTISKELGWRQ
ncbi:IclR family transcriptional regulator [Mycobacterium sp. 21AC1]|uniref:IclR family transcriptional regulator n=1 Tax=[Mycobacterium] appelbergii TaxID=2939269 RepID=UPI0029390773|nr:IclR family transcriptional regulator [Mycobacterium sp. 21AC1]MDV3124230.1 IclR family transcriptional regulator [Mycobacterium sp. 21AC1]